MQDILRQKFADKYFGLLPKSLGSFGAGGGRSNRLGGSMAETRRQLLAGNWEKVAGHRGQARQVLSSDRPKWQMAPQYMYVAKSELKIH